MVGLTVRAKSIVSLKKLVTSAGCVSLVSGDNPEESPSLKAPRLGSAGTARYPRVVFSWRCWMLLAGRLGSEQKGSNLNTRDQCECDRGHQPVAPAVLGASFPGMAGRPSDGHWRRVTQAPHPAPHPPQSTGPGGEQQWPEKRVLSFMCSWVKSCHFPSRRTHTGTSGTFLSAKGMT